MGLVEFVVVVVLLVVVVVLAVIAWRVVRSVAVQTALGLATVLVLAGGFLFLGIDSLLRAVAILVMAFGVVFAFAAARNSVQR